MITTEPTLMDYELITMMRASSDMVGGADRIGTV